MNVINTGISADMAQRDPRDVSLHIPIGLLNDLSSARTRNETLQCFATWSHLIVKCERCSVALFETDGLVILGLSGDRAIPTGTKLPLHGSLPGKVYTDRASQMVNDLVNQQYPDSRQLGEKGLKSVIMAPILVGDCCFGTLGFAFKTDVSDDLDCLAIIEALAKCLATQLLIVDQIHKLAQLAKTDPLTETFNRRHFYDVSKILWDHWKDSETPFAVAAVDIDHFKLVNDKYGHDVGDEVLKDVAKRLQKSLRDGDITVRMGGEEFLLLLQNCALPQADAIARRAHYAVGGNDIHVGDQNLPITVSIGVTAVSDADASVDELCKRADQALYAAKAQGRNRVMLDPGK